MSSIDTDISSSDTFIQDIQYILKDIKYDQNAKCNEIREHFKNISSNPEDTYTTREQVAILIEIMNCYNKNIKEYQKNMAELSIITKNIIKAHNINHRIETVKPSRRKSKGGLLLFDNCVSLQDNEDIPPTENLPNQRPILSLYDYFMELIWGAKDTPPETFTVDKLTSNGEPAVNFSDIFQDADSNIQYTNSATVSPENQPIANTIIANKKPSKRRNTIQPIIKHIPHM